jgi:4-amino-4-deoxy-L-arabinose transferase-like glycosyltransferase
LRYCLIGGADRGHPEWLLAFVALAAHLAVWNGYGYFVDELYFIVCGEHPARGYVDQPPLIPLIAAASYHLFPGVVLALRIVPALAHAATVALGGATARRLGGGWWAAFIAALSILTAPVFGAIGTTLSTGAIEPLAGLFCAYALIRVIREGDERWWLALGLAAGIALEAKYLIAFWLAGLGVGLVATPARRSLARPYLYAGAAIAGLVWLPNLLWQNAHAWPFIELGRAAVEHKNVVIAPPAFLLQVINQFNPAAAPVWIAGLVGFAFWRRLADLRLFAIAAVAIFAAFVILHGKPYYLANAMPGLFAGGAVAIEAWLIRRLRVTLAVAIAASGFVSVPFVLPVLPIAEFAAYQHALGFTTQPEWRGGKIGALPLYYADMFGWPQLAGQVAQIYRALPPDKQARAVFLGNNYGEAAAIDVLGRPLGLPPAISGHNNYFPWGPRGHDGSVVIRLGGKSEDLLKVYASCAAAGTTDNPWAIPAETGKILWVCRGRQPPMDKAWPSFKHYE